MSEDGDATSQVDEVTPDVVVPPVDPGQSFVVGIDRDAVLRRREVVRTVERRGGWVTAALGAIGIVAAVYALFAFPGSGMWPFALLLIAAMIPLLLSTVLVYRVQAERQAWYDANELPPVAMRISAKGLELACDGAAYPVVLPWPTVRGFTQHKLLGQYMLDIALERGVGATTAGVRGLDQPSVRSVVKPNPLLRPTGMFLVKALDQPVHVIDEALRHFSNGKAGIRR
ncbi:hypothetical protein GCM10009630_13030 [Kribbella jejuensis]|uniref:Uncharacterized protein n=1 Tax=Kribbella jejuensis TaxID=236068 RepID=A0A542E9I1_9ACTN|nr:hypothetical protein [Kribbella jejuensis]TQJ11959.1 hypothetical protein FB475_4884 [Kribbella jejuensis]